MATSYPEATHSVPGAPRAAGVGRRSRVALAGLIGAVTLVFGLGAVTASVAAAAVPSFSWATKGGGTAATDAVSGLGISALADGSSIIAGQFRGTASFGATTLVSTGINDTLTAKLNADGTYAWAVRGGGTGNETVWGLSALADGSSIITGTFSGIATFGATTLTSTGAPNDTFTAKVNADGTYAWATQSSGAGDDYSYSASAFSDGSSIITGFFSGTATFGATTLISAGADAAFIAKLNANGTYAWATQTGGTGSVGGTGVSALSDGSGIITGYLSGTATFGATTLISSGGSYDAFTAKVNADGTYAWATQSSGTGFDVAWGVSAFADGSSIITGQFVGTATFGATTLTSTGSQNSFTAKVNADGTYAWATQAGGAGDDLSYGVSELADGSSIITGQFSGTATFGATTLVSAGSDDIFTAKLNADGTYAWAIKAGGLGNDGAWGVAALSDGSSTIVGSFRQTATFGATSLTSAPGSNDAFTARILADAPQAPTGASASAGVQEATITWTAVAGGLVSSYTATAAPGGASCTAVAPAVTCTITGLTAGTSYSATVTATNPQGTSPASQASNAVTPTALPAPSVSISESPSSLTTGNSSTLSWSSSNVSSCSASGSWSGSQGGSGSVSTGVLVAAGSYTYTLSCTGPGGSANASTTVTATPPLTPPVDEPQSVIVTPDEPGTVAVEVTDGTSATPITITTTWDPGTFTEPVTVTASPRPPSPGGFAVGSTIIQLTVTDAAGNPVTRFAKPLRLHISASEADNVPAYSQDGITWRPIPRLTSLPLPPTQEDGYFVNTDGSIDIYTRHATFFGLVKATKFKIGSVKAGLKALTSTVVLPGRGALAQIVTRKSATGAVLTVCKTSAKVTKAGKVKLTCKLSSATRAALRKRSLRVSVKTTFTPTGGLSASKTQAVTLKSQRPSPPPYTG